MKKECEHYSDGGCLLLSKFFFGGFMKARCAFDGEGKKKKDCPYFKVKDKDKEK
jgi:hypothetical protein